VPLREVEESALNITEVEVTDKISIETILISSAKLSVEIC
jgi:hypothetical protein